MKSKLNNLRVINCGICLYLLAGMVRADESLNNQFATNDKNQMDWHRSYRLNGVTKASDVIGEKVKDNQDADLGKVSDLLLDVEAGRVVQVLVTSGGLMGVGGTVMALPPGIVREDATNRTVHLDVAKDKFEAGPKFATTDPTDGMSASNAVYETYNYYGQRPFFTAGRYGTNDLEETMGGPLPLHMDGTPNVTGGRLMDVVNNQKIAERNGQDTNGMTSQSMTNGMWNGNRSMERARLGYAQKASKLMGLPVMNMQGEKIGSVKNFAVDVAAGRIVAVIISVGGYLGMGGELSAVPPSALRFAGGHDGFEINATKETLANGPHFNANQWPDFSQPAYAGEVYHAYNTEPYFSGNNSTNGSMAADNSGRNARDRSGRTVTPMDQGNSQSDINTTAQIRKEIMANQAMSVNAKNIKIITRDGKVTLRGAVDTETEKNTIGDIAKRVAHGNENVDDELQIRSTSRN